MKYDVTIVVPCKGWLHYIKQTVPSLLRQETSSEYRVLIVDYGCPQDTLGWVKSQAQPRLHCLRVNDNTSPFNICRCRNIGARHADSRVIAFLDGDIAVAPDYVEKAMSSMLTHDCGFVNYSIARHTARHIAHGRYAFDQLPDELAGVPTHPQKIYIANSVVFIRSEILEKFKGEDELFQGWGFGHTDLYDRILSSGEKNVWIGGAFEYLHTSAEERTQFYVEKDARKSAATNLARMRTKREINPSGWGVTNDFELFEE
ncbi:MAG TPA: glycosyltransferase family A protein [Pirellulales bacterium]